ncbi:Aste57867_1398 [Aphanomyces stellatus]|uniref:Hexose transporter 1 n=1 Tax=Aphanomyces stellatus TaxID=120398 RepID=A0A485K266_9STRA|nr:hypothetical protein As57867_001397 [Aphanomyces stellatus]KAF0720666.1 hypothetical protein As57867_000091 [Aphanomyces stellatus]VFT77317.1 Aste57867_91 [Aphanomyces stellatus]VFT78615.1 Aste57867_1398 [Aphanomyces stellatus]
MKQPTYQESQLDTAEIVPDPILETTPLRVSMAFRRSVAAAFVGAVHFGWMMSEMSHLPFNNPKLCLLPRIPAGQCLFFPGHTNAEWTMQSTAWAVGGGVGALLSAYPADKFGRQRTLGFNGLVMVLGGVAQLFATDIYSFAIGRGLSGIASGIVVNVVINYLREIAPAQWRVFYFSLFQAVAAVTALGVTSLMYAIPKLPTSTWDFRPIFGGPIVIGLVQLVTMQRMIESPVWLLQHQQVNQAYAAMTELYHPGVDGHQHLATHFATVAASVARQMDDTKATIASKLTLLVSPTYRKQFGIALVLCTMQQLSGLGALIVFGPALFQSLGLVDLRLANTFVNFGRFQNNMVVAALGDRFYRRTSLVRGSVVMAIAGLGFTLCQVYPNDTTRYVLLICTLVFMMAYSFSAGSLAWLVSTELMPESLGATSGAVATAMTWTAQFFIGVIFQQIATPGHWGTQAFGIFPVVALIFATFVWFVVPETAKLTSDQVTALYCQRVDDDDANTKATASYKAIATPTTMPLEAVA